MYKRKVFLCICLFSMVLIIACSLSKESISGNNLSKTNFDIDTFKPSVAGEVWEANVYSEDIYYTEEISKPQSQFHYTTNIYQYNIKDQINKKILSLDFKDYGYIRELCVGNNQFFFTGDRFDETDTWYDIWKYSLLDNRLEKIYTHRNPIVLSCEGSHLAWYEIEESLTDDTLETANILNIFKTEDTLGYGIGSRDGYGISLHDGEEQKIVYHTE